MKRTLFAALALVLVVTAAGCASISKQYAAQMEDKRKALEALYAQDIKKCPDVPQADKDAWERNFRSWEALNAEASK